MSLGHITKIEHDCEVIEKPNKALRLDLGCGQNKKEGFLGVDVARGSQADIFHNLEHFPWPFEDCSVQEIYCAHYLEHVSDIISFFEECYRVLIPGGSLEIHCPYWSSVRAMQDPTHKQFISEATFLYYNQDWMKANKLDHYEIKADFIVSNLRFVFIDEYKIRSDAAREWARKHLINAVSDIHAVLHKRS